MPKKLNKYAVSLVYQKIDGRNVDTALRSKIEEAHSKEEALGKVICYFESNEKLKGHSLSIKNYDVD